MKRTAVVATASLALLSCARASAPDQRTGESAQDHAAVAAFADMYHRLLSFENCSRVDQYFLTTEPEAARGLQAGDIRPGLAPALRHLDRLRGDAEGKGLAAVMRDTESRWREQDSRIDYVCGWDGRRTVDQSRRLVQEFERIVARI